MSKRSRRGGNSPQSSTSEPVVKKQSVKTPLVSSEAEALRIVENNYKNPLHLEYTVLENGHVFYGINRGAALAHARKSNLKFFDIKLPDDGTE